MMLENGLSVEYSADGKPKTGPMENTFTMAQWPPRLWGLCWAIITGEVDRIGKNVDFKPVETVTHFKELTGTLTVAEKINLLNSVVRGKRTMKELATEAITLRKVKKIQKYILMDLDMRPTDWNACKAQYAKGCTSLAVDLWINTTSSFTTKPYARPDGWESFIESIKLSGSDNEDISLTGKTKKFSFEGRKYVFHNGNVFSLYTLLGSCKGDYGIFYSYYYF